MKLPGKIKNFLILIFLSILISCASTTQTNLNKEKTITELKIAEDYNAGLLALSLNDFSKAERLLLRCVKYNYNLPFSYLYLGITYYKMKKYDLSEKYLKKALEIKPDLTEAHNSLGAVYAAQKKYSLALDEFHKVLLDPGYLFPENALYNIALIYYHMGEYLKSIDYCNKTLVIVPKSPMVYYLIALNYVKLGKKKLAKKYLTDIIKNFPKSTWADVAKKYMKENKI